MKTRTIAIVTGTRAEYGLLKPLIELVHNDSELCLELLVTGSHLSANHGDTWREIERDGFRITRKIEILQVSDSFVGVCKAMGLAHISFAEIFDLIRPDFVVILGDRYEMLAIASTALMANIPIAHIHGGELTYGAIDDSIRHSITKMSSLHFTASEQYRKRVIQMGEQPSTVFNVGALGIDSINNLKLLSKRELEDMLGIKLKSINFIITFHPETKNLLPVKEQLNELLLALDEQEDVFMLFTGANADSSGNEINNVLKHYAASRPENCAFFSSLGQLRYLSCLRHFNMIIGNSSSGIIESPSFKIPVVNIGDRQIGRLMSKNIINCKINYEDISNAIKIGLSPSFRNEFEDLSSPYGEGKASEQILQVLKTFRVPEQKIFFEHA